MFFKFSCKETRLDIKEETFLSGGGGVQIGVGHQREIRKIRLALTPIYPLIAQELLTGDRTNIHQVSSIAAPGGSVQFR